MRQRWCDGAEGGLVGRWRCGPWRSRIEVAIEVAVEVAIEVAVVMEVGAMAIEMEEAVVMEVGMMESGGGDDGEWRWERWRSS